MPSLRSPTYRPSKPKSAKVVLAKLVAIHATMANIANVGFSSKGRPSLLPVTPALLAILFANRGERIRCL